MLPARVAAIDQKDVPLMADVLVANYPALMSAGLVSVLPSGRHSPSRSLRRYSSRLIKDGFYSKVRVNHDLGCRADFDFVDFAIYSCPFFVEQMLRANVDLLQNIKQIANEREP